MDTPLGPGAEFDLIRAFLHSRGEAGRWLPPNVLVGPGDDCAVLRTAALAVSVDMSVEGVHFRREWLEPEEIGYRAAAAALSDLAAMAALPAGVLVAAAVPTRDAGDFMVRVMAGAREAAERAGTGILGGDLTRTDGPLVLDVLVLGDCPSPVTRRGAVPGDALWVTGELGAAAAAVSAWQRGRTPALAARTAFARPSPRLAEARWLAERGVLHALIDLSDGLAGDAGHLAAASGVRIMLETDSIPVHSAVLSASERPDDRLRLALAGGDDYELCFASPPGVVEPLRDEFVAQFGTGLTRVGSVSAGSGVSLRAADGSERELEFAGFDHFGPPQP